MASAFFDLHVTGSRTQNAASLKQAKNRSKASLAACLPVPELVAAGRESLCSFIYAMYSGSLAMQWIPWKPPPGARQPAEQPKAKPSG
jgi:hypothetical protein